MNKTNINQCTWTEDDETIILCTGPCYKAKEELINNFMQGIETYHVCPRKDKCIDEYYANNKK